MATVDESLPSVDDARKVFYSAGDHQLAKNLQEEEYEKRGEQNRVLRHRVQSDLGQSFGDYAVAKKMLTEDEKIARALQDEEDEQSRAEVDKTVAEELQHQLNLEDESVKAAREMQDVEFAKYLHEKQKAREKELLQQQQQLQDEEARRLQQEEVEKWREEKEKTAATDQEFAKHVQDSERQQAQQERDRQAEDEFMARELQRREVHAYKRALSDVSTLPATSPAGATQSLPAHVAGQGEQPSAGASSPGRRRSLQEAGRGGSEDQSPGTTRPANPENPGDAVQVPKMNKRRVAKKK